MRAGGSAIVYGGQIADEVQMVASSSTVAPVALAAATEMTDDLARVEPAWAPGQGGDEPEHR